MHSPSFRRARTLGSSSTPKSPGFFLASPKSRSPSKIFKELFTKIESISPLSTPAESTPKSPGFFLASPKNRSPSKIFNELSTIFESISPLSEAAESDTTIAVPTTQVSNNRDNPLPEFQPVPNTPEREFEAMEAWQKRRSEMHLKGYWEIGEKKHYFHCDLPPVMEEVAEGDDRNKRKVSTVPGPAEKDFGRGQTARQGVNEES